jgi:hypothetical protein
MKGDIRKNFLIVSQKFIVYQTILSILLLPRRGERLVGLPFP